MNDKLKWMALGSLSIVVVIYASTGLRATPRMPQEVPPPKRSEPGARQAKSKSLQLSSALLDMGEVKVGETRFATAAVENMGNESVSIQRISPSCDCMNGEADVKVILPGRTSALKVGFTGTPGRRSYVGTISIISDESGPSRYDIQVRATVIQDVMVSPEIVDFGTADKKAIVVREVVVRHRDHRYFQLNSVWSGREELKFSWAPLEEASGGGYKIRCELTATHSGILTDTMRIETNDPICPTVEAYLRAKVESELVCSPPNVEGKVDPDPKSCRFEASIGSKAHRSVQIESVREGQGRSLEFSKANMEDGGQKLEIILKESPPSGILLGEFLVTVKGEPDPLILPYRVEAPGGKVTEKP